MFEHINLPDNILPPVAPYSHAVRAGDFLFVTGQLSEDPQTGRVILGTIEDQTRRVMDNLKLVLDRANTNFERVVMARIFLTNFQDYAKINEIYLSYFQGHPLPSRTTVGITELAGLGDIEIDLIVYCGS
ncbi:MAG: RidA family protein [Spirulinaceae cyanobacterium]